MPNSSIYKLITDYTNGRIALFDLQDWISSREEQWASRPSDPESQAAGSIMLAFYEFGAGDRDEESVRQIAREALVELERAQRV